jgi:uncharacterized protein YegJ (DUF2314 family)
VRRVLVLAALLAPFALAAPLRADITAAATPAPVDAATAKARATLPQFIEILRHRPKSARFVNLKVRFSDGKATHDAWMDGVSYFKKTIQVLDDDDDAPQVKKKAKNVAVKPEDILDWMYVDKGLLFGGYTIRAARDRMSEADRKAFDSTLPFKIQ